MKKLNMKTKDLKEENIAKLTKLFPELLTEIEKDGKIIKTINVDKLKELVGDFATDKDETYELTWMGKQKSKQKIAEPITETLRPIPKESINFENAENLYIEGDSFEILKLLQESYLNKIKMIYIDPPYNRGSDLVYKDDFSMTKEEYEQKAGAIDEEGQKLLKVNTKTNPRFHSDWLNMMYIRLVIAKDLLTDDGVIFISIDDNEIDNLIKLCNEIFSENNYIDTFLIRSNPRGNQAKKFTASEHEYILCFSKDRSKMNPLGFPKKKEEYTKKDDCGFFREIGLRKRGAGARRVDAPHQYFPIFYNPKEEIIDIERVSKDYVEILPKLSTGEDGRWRWSKKSVLEKRKKLLVRLVNRGGTPEYDVFEKDYFEEGKISKIKSIFYEKEVNYELGTEELKDLFDGIKIFDYPKPVYLIEKLIRSLNSKSDIFLDFFSGSATTAHAVMQLNAEDGGNRKFIMVQLPEETDKESDAFKAGYKNICEIGKARIKRAAQNLDVDFGFRVFKLDTSNMKDVYYNPKELEQKKLLGHEDNVKEDRTDKDLLFHVLLDMAVPISAKVKEEKVDNKTIYKINENFLIACFEKNIDLETIKKIAELKPLRLVFKDSSFKDDATKINCEQHIKNKLPETITRVI